MRSTKPFQITVEEWKEIISIPGIRNYFRIKPGTTPEVFASRVYGVKFKYFAPSTDFKGEMFLIQQPNATYVHPIMILRMDGKLEVQNLLSSPVVWG